MTHPVKTEKRTGNWLHADELAGLKATMQRLGITQQVIADAHGCRRQFVTNVLAGREPCPDRLLKLLRRRIARAERAASRA